MGVKNIFQGHRLGPNFANNASNTFTVTGAAAPAATIAFRVIAKSSCNINSLNVYVGSASGVPTDVRVSVYTDSNGNVGSLIGGTESTGVGVTTNSVNSFAFPAATAVTALTSYWCVLKNYTASTSFNVSTTDFSGWTSAIINRSAISSVADTFGTYNSARGYGVVFSDGHIVENLNATESTSFFGMTGDTHYILHEFNSIGQDLTITGLILSLANSSLNAGTNIVVDMTVNGGPVIRNIPYNAALGATNLGTYIPFFDSIFIPAMARVTVKIYTSGRASGTLYCYYDNGKANWPNEKITTYNGSTTTVLSNKGAYIQFVMDETVLSIKKYLNRRQYFDQR